MATLSITSTSASFNAFPIRSSSDMPSAAAVSSVSSTLSLSVPSHRHRTAAVFLSRLSSSPVNTTAASSSSTRRIVIRKVALKSESEPSATEADEEAVSKVGSRVRVKVPLKVYHVPKVAEVDLTGKEGVIKQYVGVWKGKRISANLPYKVEFQAEVPERGVVKFSAHLREDELEFLG